MQTRVADMLGIDIPIIQAPMGYIARAQLASAVSNAGGMGIIETSSGRLDEVKLEIEKMRDLTDRPWGVNIAQLFVRDRVGLETIVDFVVAHGVRFVTTSAGDPSVLTPTLKAAGITVFHVVPTLRGALKAIAAGVDGLVVEGVEGGGFKNADGASSMVLVPLIAQAIKQIRDVPIVCAGGVSDGISMAAAFDARGRGGADGHPDADGGRVAGARELEAGGRRRSRDRHRRGEPLREAVDAHAAHRPLVVSRTRRASAVAGASTA